MKLTEKTKVTAGYIAVLLTFVAVAVFCPQLEEGANYGFWTVLPAIQIFAFILLTKHILEGFFWSSMLAVFIRFRWGITTAFIDQIFENVTNWDNFWVIYLFMLAGAITFLLRMSGAGTYFARWVSSKVKSPKAALLVTFILGTPLCIDDYMSGLIIGASMSPVNDTYGIPREMTAYVIRATIAAPACILPIGCWGIYVGQVIDIWGLDIVGSGSGFQYYLANVLPWLFFPFTVMLVALLVILGVIPMFGKMKRAYQRVADGGPTKPPVEHRDSDGNIIEEEEEEIPEPRKHVNLLHFIVPIVAIMLCGWYYEWDMAYGITVGLLISFIFNIITKVFTVNDAKEVVTQGFGYMSEMCIMMAFGLVLCNNMAELGFVDYIVSLTESLVTPSMLPFIIFFAFSCTEILVTFNYTLYLIAMPIVVALAQSVGASVPMSIGALVSCGVFGYCLAFSSDEGMIVCGACGAIDIYEQNTCQYPYMIMAWALAAIGYLVCGFIF